MPTENDSPITDRARIESLANAGKLVGVRIGCRNFNNSSYNRKMDFSGATFVVPVSFARTHFSHQVSFKDTVFEQSVNFKGTKFTDKANFVDFKGAQFKDNASFKGAEFFSVGLNQDIGNFRFKLAADFSGAQFKSKTDFSESRFNGKVKFEETKFFKEAGFLKVKFKSLVEFHKAEFNIEADFTTNFSSARFGDVADFSESIFSNYVDFGDAWFKEKANFFCTRFDRSVSFKEATFESRAIFEGNRQKKIDVFPDTANHNFTNVNFGQSGQVLFKQVYLGKTAFLDTNVSKVDFTDVGWAEDELENRFISWLTRLANYKRYIVHDEIIARSENRDYELVEKLYRQLKLNFEAKGYYNRAGDFHYGEMEMRRLQKKLQKNWFKRRVSVVALYKYVSGYGEWYGLPLIWLVALIFILPSFYLLSGMESTVDNTIINYDIASA